MAKSTPATLALGRAGVAFELVEYPYDPGSMRVGLQAAAALGEEPRRVLKTLMALVDEAPTCVVLASDREISLKALAAILGGKSARMMTPAEAERRTGYVIGGVSPFGQKRPAPVVVDTAALEEDQVFINAGRRGLQARLSPRDLVAALGAVVASVAA